MNQPAVDPRVQREEYYQRIATKHLTPLWEVLAALVPEKPASPCVATIWRYAEPAGRKIVTGSLNAAAGRLLPHFARFADWYVRKASEWVAGVPLRIK